MPTIRVRYPGRACLLGEHCDWAGGSSLTVPTPMGIEVRAEHARDGLLVRSQMDSEFLEYRFAIDDAPPINGPLRFIPAILKQLRELEIEVPPSELWVNSTLPAGRGLSSSAAFSLACLDALTRLAGTPMTSSELVEAAYHVENRHLQIGCGRLDPAACAAAEPLLLRWPLSPDATAIGIRQTRVQPFGTLHLIVGVFPVHRDSGPILTALHTHHKAPLGDVTGDAVREAFAEFGAAAERGAHALRTGNFTLLGEAMDHVQEIYESNLGDQIPIMHAPKLRKIVRSIRAKGSIGTKFSGAGGDSSMVALFATENAARSATIWLETKGLHAWYVPIQSA